jgi:hypothetical protein
MLKLLEKWFFIYQWFQIIGNCTPKYRTIFSFMHGDFKMTQISDCCHLRRIDGEA